MDLIVEEDPHGGMTAHAVGSWIFTQGDTPEQFRENVRDAVRCDFCDEKSRPKVIRLHHVCSRRGLLGLASII